MIASQKRLTRRLIALAAVGSLLIGLLWWDSTQYGIWWVEKSSLTVGSQSSGIVAFVFPSVKFFAKDKPLSETNHFIRQRIEPRAFNVGKLFPAPQLFYYPIFIPYYLLLVTYLSSIVVAWLVLMNRLTRREIASSADY